MRLTVSGISPTLLTAVGLIVPHHVYCPSGNLYHIPGLQISDVVKVTARAIHIMGYCIALFFQHSCCTSNMQCIIAIVWVATVSDQLIRPCSFSHHQSWFCRRMISLDTYGQTSTPAKTDLVLLNCACLECWVASEACLTHIPCGVDHATVS